MDIASAQPVSPATPPFATPSSLRALRAAALVAVAFTVGNAAWAAWDQDTTYDEPYHLRWPERLLDERADGREEFRLDSKTPALLPAVLFRKAASRAGVESPQALRFSTRLPSIAWLAAALALVAALSRTANPATVWIGLLLAALDPNLAAHASIATTDLPYTVVVLSLAAAIAPLGPSVASSVAIGALLGAAFAVKYTAVLLVPVAVMALLARSGSWRQRALFVLAASLAAWFTASSLYLWVGVFHPLGAVALETPFLKGVAAALRGVPLPLPRSILTGIDASMAHNVPAYWSSYLFGTEHRGGVWYYFVANWLMKTPVSLLLLILVGILGLRRGWRDRVVLATLALFIIHLGYFSFFFATQIGLRFALPCVALGCVLAARGLGGVKPWWLLAAAVLALVERAPYWEDPIAFTNLSVWPKSRAYWFTADSNLDYGQNRGRLARYAKQTGLALILDQATPTPGRYVAGANALVIFETRRSHRWLVDRDVPASNVGFTYFAFGLTGELFDEYLTDARSTAARPGFDEACGGEMVHYPPGAQVPFDQTVNPAAGRLWLVCVTSRKGADIGLTLSAGRAWFGRVTENGACEADLLQEKQQAWFRVPGGAASQLCLQEIPLRRSHLPYRTSGYLTVRGQGADLDVREVTVGSVALNPPDRTGTK